MHAISPRPGVFSYEARASAIAIAIAIAITTATPTGATATVAIGGRRHPVTFTFPFPNARADRGLYLLSATRHVLTFKSLHELGHYSQEKPLAILLDTEVPEEDDLCPK
jgi:hypothetical protein